jgi:hypothetical protein
LALVSIGQVLEQLFEENTLLLHPAKITHTQDITRLNLATTWLINQSVAATGIVGGHMRSW